MFECGPSDDCFQNLNKNLRHYIYMGVLLLPSRASQFQPSDDQWRPRFFPKDQENQSASLERS